MAFDMFRLHKLADRLDAEAYEHAQWAIAEFYNLELKENEYGYEQDVCEVLTKEQIEEIDAYISENTQENMWHEPYTISALNYIVDRWYEEQEGDDRWSTISFDDD